MSNVRQIQMSSCGQCGQFVIFMSISYFIVWCSKKPVFTVYLWCLNIRRMYYYINTYEFIFTFGSLHERLFLV
jgi:hypothetical protein